MVPRGTKHRIVVGCGRLWVVGCVLWCVALIRYLLGGVVEIGGGVWGCVGAEVGLLVVVFF